jgi:hypothetical protein
VTEKDPSDGHRTEQDDLELDQESIRDLDVEGDEGEDVRGGQPCKATSCPYVS